MRQAKKKKEMVEDRFGLQVQKHDSTAVPEGSSAYHLHVHLGLVRTSEPLCFAFNREELQHFSATTSVLPVSRLRFFCYLAVHAHRYVRQLLIGNFSNIGTHTTTQTPFQPVHTSVLPFSPPKAAALLPPTISYHLLCPFPWPLATLASRPR
uniref:Uncharacterized protein n=1 Tax=Palpitomonas bilix TaxID=652834 RepID=A0A7S3DCF8_9EUKA|mmetsp:Transcript_31063/g.81519  ORF Transcript_31063/g.81519 Transcript_31063/m.81519 type:complete len:152 (+) Transcript_31063:25-480(+)